MNEQMTAREALWNTKDPDVMDAIMATMIDAAQEYQGYIDADIDAVLPFTIPDRADEIIDRYNSYLWSRAMQPEVVARVARAIQEAEFGPGSWGDETDDEDRYEQALCMEIAQASITAMLTALIGPNPKEIER